MSLSMSRTLPLVALAALIALAGTGIGAGAVEHTQPENTRSRQGGAPDIGAMLIRGLNNSPGCFKVITAQTSVGSNSIIAWFENKAAVEEWYYSNTHTRVMGMVGSDPDTKKPMAHVEDENIPVMVMASITLAEKGVLPGPMPVSQISIELYTPLDAGASVNGRLMPEEIKLEHFNAI
ncbi:MAG: hypothetical protein ACF8K1_04135 [Phycisphaerales bacterium JB047]